MRNAIRMSVSAATVTVCGLGAVGFVGVAPALAYPPLPHYVNETNANEEADYCNIQFPATMNVAAGSSTPTIYGQIYEASMTPAIGPNGNIVVQFGYGPVGTDPFVNDSAWTWFSASYNVQLGNNDEYQRSIIAPGAGTYLYTFRFNLSTTNAGANVGWTLADTNGTGSNVGLTYEAANLGVMTVTPTPGAAALIGLGGLASMRRRRV